MNPCQCPICDEIDEDGLEACSECYNTVTANAVAAKREIKELKGQLADARQIAELQRHKLELEKVKNGALKERLTEERAAYQRMLEKYAEVRAELLIERKKR
jgi:hypothetical protein